MHLQMRFTEKVSIWLVGISGGLKFEGPSCSDGRVTGWYSAWDATRPFQVDMAGMSLLQANTALSQTPCLSLLTFTFDDLYLYTMNIVRKFVNASMYVQVRVNKHDLCIVLMFLANIVA